MALPLQFSAFLILTILIAPKAVECFSSSNATRVVDLLVDEDDEEFSMDSEANRRILQAGKRTPKVPYAKYTLQFCKANVYGSCIGADSKIYKRACDYLNTCGKTKS